MAVLIEPTEVFGKRDTPADEPKEQYLFLLELFVYRVTGERLSKLNRMFFVPTRVSFKFLDFGDDDMAVTPVDPMFEPQAGIGDDVENFNSGRSVTFAMARNLVTEKIMNFTIKFVVEKQMPKKINPNIIVGIGELDMSNHLAALRKEMLQCWHTNCPPPKIYEGNVDLFLEDKLVGSVSIYVRISGFGQSIVTEIESPTLDKKSSTYVFKSQENDDQQLSYKCRKINSRTLDICKDSEEDLTDSVGHRYVCSPCGLKGASKKDKASVLKSILCGKPLTTAWEPQMLAKENSNDENRCILPIQSSRGPSKPCGKAVVLKISGLIDVDDPDGSYNRRRRHEPTVTVAREGDAVRNNVDPDHDIFILRIGKKGVVGEDEKCDLQLEMRTPKGPERRPPIRYETREIQTDENTGKGNVKNAKNKGKGKNKKKKKK